MSEYQSAFIDPKLACSLSTSEEISTGFGCIKHSETHALPVQESVDVMKCNASENLSVVKVCPPSCRLFQYETLDFRHLAVSVRCLMETM
jgi:hypothetical protein